MPNRKVTPPTFEELITRIWARSDAGGKPRFCIDPDNGLVTYKHEPVTHYDFVWVDKGLCAKLLLYQETICGEVIYGAALDAETKKLGEIHFIWDIKKQKFEE